MGRLGCRCVKTGGAGSMGKLLLGRDGYMDFLGFWGVAAWVNRAFLAMPFELGCEGGILSGASELCFFPLETGETYFFDNRSYSEAFDARRFDNGAVYSSAASEAGKIGSGYSGCGLDKDTGGSVWGRLSADFEADVQAGLGACADNGVFHRDLVFGSVDGGVGSRFLGNCFEGGRETVPLGSFGDYAERAMCGGRVIRLFESSGAVFSGDTESGFEEKLPKDFCGNGGVFPFGRVKDGGGDRAADRFFLGGSAEILGNAWAGLGGAISGIGLGRLSVFLGGGVGSADLNGVGKRFVESCGWNGRTVFFGSADDSRRVRSIALEAGEADNKGAGGLFWDGGLRLCGVGCGFGGGAFGDLGFRSCGDSGFGSLAVGGNAGAAELCAAEREISAAGRRGGALLETQAAHTAPKAWKGEIDRLWIESVSGLFSCGAELREIRELRSAAGQAGVNYFTSAEVKIDVSGGSGSVDGIDMDELTQRLSEAIGEAVANISEGVHNI